MHVRSSKKKDTVAALELRSVSFPGRNLPAPLKRAGSLVRRVGRCKVHGAVPFHELHAVHSLQRRYTVLGHRAGQRAEDGLLTGDGQAGTSRAFHRLREPVGVDRENDPDRPGPAHGACSRPVPMSSTGCGKGNAPASNCALRSAAEESGFPWPSNAATPATCGVAMLVPLIGW